MKKETLFYITVAITLFLVHCPLMYEIQPDRIDVWGKFQYQKIINVETTEIILLTCIKAIAFSIGTVIMLSMLKKSNIETKKKRRLIYTFAVLDGFALLLYTNWMDSLIKNQIASIYYAVFFTVLIASLSFLMIETTVKHYGNNETPEKQRVKELVQKGYSQRKIANELGISASTVNRLINN